MIRFFKIAFFLVLPFAVFAQKTDIFGLEASKKYAIHLFNSANFEAAALEYERLLILDSTHHDNYRYWALVSYRKSAQIATGFNRLNDWFPDKEVLRFPLNKEFSLYLTSKGLYHEAIDFLKLTDDIALEEQATLLAINYCYLSNWDDANEQLQKIENHTIIQDILAIAILKGKHLKLKKPLLAATLSIIPGFGRIYTGNYADAGLSLLTITTFAWQAYTGFNKNGTKSAYGWAVGSVAAGFYFGNIYGSYRAAQLYNKQQLEIVIYEIDRAYSHFI